MSLNSNHSNAVSTASRTLNLKPEEINYIWTIENFSTLDEKNETIYSPEFSLNNNCKWRLQLEPSEMIREDGAVFIGLYLNLRPSSKSTKVCAKFTFLILNEKHDEIWSSEYEFLYNSFDNLSDDDDSYGFHEFCEKNEFFKNRILIDDKLTISCKVTFFEMNEENIEAIFYRCTNPLSLQHLAEDLASMRENENLADVVLSVSGKDYAAHKCILSARSKVFAAMFRNDTKENREHRVEITDMEKEVMKELLCYIYSGSCENVENLAGDLLVAAEKYHLADLKSFCEESLYKELTVENASSMLVLADTYHAKELKSKIIDFIVTQSFKVVSSASWNSIMPSYPKLINEVCVALSRLGSTT